MLDNEPHGAAAPSRSPPHDFCGTETDDRLSAWVDVLERQVDLFLPLEIAVIAALPGWARAKAVLDVGCGNGRHLAELARCFPAKTFLGIEASPEFVVAARERWPRLDIVQTDYFAFAPRRRFDFMIMRFVVQHLENWEAVLDQARSLLAPGGSLLIVEPDVTAFDNAPALPHFTQMLARYGEEAKARGRLRASLDELASRAAEREWQLARETRDAVTTSGPGTGDRVLPLYRGWTVLCRQCGYVEADYDAVEGELAAWKDSPDACSTIGLRFVALQAPEG